MAVFFNRQKVADRQFGNSEVYCSSNKVVFNLLEGTACGFLCLKEDSQAAQRKKRHSQSSIDCRGRQHLKQNVAGNNCRNCGNTEECTAADDGTSHGGRCGFAHHQCRQGQNIGAAADAGTEQSARNNTAHDTVPDKGCAKGKSTI